MSMNNRSYQSQFERLNTSKFNNSSSGSQFQYPNGDSSHSNNASNVTDVEGLSASFQPHRRHYPNSFADLSNSTNIVYPAGGSEPDLSRQARTSEGKSSSSRYQRLLGSLGPFHEDNSGTSQPPLNKQLGPAISQYDPLDKPSSRAKQQQQQQQPVQSSQQTTRTTRPPAKGILSARVVNNTEWKSIMSQPKSNRSARVSSRSVSPRKTAAAVAAAAGRKGQSSRGSRTAAGAPAGSSSSQITLSSCLRSQAAGNNALDPSGKLQLVSCYMTHLDALPPALAQRVRVLYLSNNSIASLQGIQQFSNLTTLSLANNSLRYIHDLTPLAALTRLERLALEGNVVTSMPFYRELLLGICSSYSGADTNTPPRGLQVLDGVKVSAQEQGGVRALFRKVCGQMDLMRCNELRVCVLEHVCALTACHSQLVAEVLGKFRYVWRRRRTRLCRTISHLPLSV
jgi:hypothetical protein